MLSPGARKYCTLARDYQGATTRYSRRAIDKEMRAMELNDREIEVLAACYSDDELVAMLEKDEKEVGYLTRAMLIYFCDRMGDYREFFDVNGGEHMVISRIVTTDTTASIEIDGTIFDVTITRREA